VSKIVRIPILPFKMVNAHLVIDNQGCLLVDAGLPGSAAKIGKALSSHGMSFRDIKAIVITHAHVDHAGAAAELRERSGAPIVAHEADLPHYKREVPMTFCPTGWTGRIFLKTPLPHQNYTAFEPDVLLSNGETLELSPFGVNGVVKHTPGHTRGSLSVQLGSKEALVGDLVASGILIGGLLRTSHAIRPPFEDDPQSVAKELLRFVDGGMDRFYLGHGAALDAREVRRHAETLARMPSQTRRA